MSNEKPIVPPTEGTPEQELRSELLTVLRQSEAVALAMDPDKSVTAIEKELDTLLGSDSESEACKNTTPYKKITSGKRTYSFHTDNNGHFWLKMEDVNSTTPEVTE